MTSTPAPVPSAAATPTVAAKPTLTVAVATSTVAPGGSEAVAVVAPSGAPVTVTIAYPNGFIASEHGVTSADGVYRLTFTVPATMRAGMAKITVSADGATAGSAFTVS